jgi:hypothetical protein
MRFFLYSLYALALQKLHFRHAIKSARVCGRLHVLPLGELPRSDSTRGEGSGNVCSAAHLVAFTKIYSQQPFPLPTLVLRRSWPHRAPLLYNEFKQLGD